MWPMKNSARNKAISNHLIIFICGVMMSATSAQALDSDRNIALAQLRRQDQVLASIAQRLTIANAPLCDEQMPASGLVLHTIDQYPSALANDVKAVFGFPSPVAAEIVLPASPAEVAGVKVGDGIEAIDGITLSAATVNMSVPNTQRRDAIERQILRLPPLAPMRVTVKRSDMLQTLVIHPVAACRARFEVIPDSSWTARSDGELIQVSARFVDRLSKAELAVVVSHELAHTVLRHRRRLHAADVDKGLLSEFGRNGRLNRRAEDEADQLSVYLLHNAGFDPKSAPAFWRKHGDMLGGWLFRRRTHASPAARARAMEAEITKIPGDSPITTYTPPLLSTRNQPFE